MKKLFIGLLALTSLSTFAGEEICGKVSKLKYGISGTFVEVEISNQAVTEKIRTLGNSFIEVLLTAKINNLDVCATGLYQMGTRPRDILFKELIIK